MSVAATRDREWKALARRAAGRVEANAVHAQHFLVFALDASAYALPVERVREIVRLRPITPVPRLPAEVPGVIALRGQVIQVIDLRRRLGLALRPEAAESAARRRARIVVAHDGDGRVVGILVDRVEEVISVGEEELRSPPGGHAGHVESLFRQRDRFVSVVDLDRVMAIEPQEHADVG